MPYLTFTYEVYTVSRMNNHESLSSLSSAAIIGDSLRKYPQLHLLDPHIWHHSTLGARFLDLLHVIDATPPSVRFFFIVCGSNDVTSDSIVECIEHLDLQLTQLQASRPEAVAILLHIPSRSPSFFVRHFDPPHDLMRSITRSSA